MFSNSDQIDWGFGVGVIITGDGTVDTSINAGIGSKGSCPNCRTFSQGTTNNLPMLILGAALIVLLLRK